MRTCTGLSWHIFHPKTDAYTIANSPQLGTCTGTKITPFLNANLVSISLIFISPGWGYQTEYILRNCIASLIVAENTSLVCVRKLLLDPTYRRTILKQVTDPTVLSFWHDEFETWEAKFRRPAITPPLNKRPCTCTLRLNTTRLTRRPSQG